MHYLFIHAYYGPDTPGGIETLIGRMSKWLVKRGHRVTLLTATADKWLYVLPKEVQCFQLKEKFREFFYPFHAARLWKRLGITDVNVIKTFDLPTSWVGSIISGLGRKPAKVIAGIYNPYVFNYKQGGQVLMNGWPLYLKNYLKNIPGDARVFCDAEELRDLKLMHGNQEKAVFWPLPVDGERFEGVKRTPQWGHIVSIGRLAPMKEYNFYMVDVVAKLRNAGYDVKWTVYGSGAYKPRMQELIKEREMEDYIILQGDIDYRHLEKAMQEAYVFVGMGTAYLEASFCRVPGLLALPYEINGLTWGPIYNRPFGTTPQVGELPKLHVFEEIVRILKLSETEYHKEAERVHNHVQAYNLDNRMREFEALVEQAGYPRRNRFLYWQNYLYAIGRALGVRLDGLAGINKQPLKLEPAMVTNN